MRYRTPDLAAPIETLVERARAQIKEAIVMAAGFDPFLERARKALRAIEVDEATMIAESFGPAV